MVSVPQSADPLALAPAVAEAAERIRARWTESERQKRFVHAWHVPITAPSQQQEEAADD